MQQESVRPGVTKRGRRRGPEADRSDAFGSACRISDDAVRPVGGNCRAMLRNANVNVSEDTCKDGFGNDIIIFTSSASGGPVYTLASGGREGAMRKQEPISEAAFLWRNGRWINLPSETPP